ncbi:sugar phosphate isomerase/epimerase family protein [Gracilibacillus alcaliphilus]|uniref:sugar phosphate isomerase/epimerase family protein n=1 Tax=Gracilibacillus alcaliphilus TaxID=1401441 RepID=UPI00195D30D5|nr:sugar phosphate isomerase/epimerase family protein [Gracilibacillus alcaliphilus]MBM7676825.1 sugar phosphate isomerase/epimerase [Gracilibacillus alcaliphilus]
MLKGIGKAGLDNVQNLEELIILASTNGFDAVDTDFTDLKVFVEEKGENEARDFLKVNNIKLGSVSLPVNWRTSDKNFQQSMTDLIESAMIANKLGCTTFFTFFFPSTDEYPAAYLIKLTNRLRVCANLLKQYDITLALEFVGPVHLRNKWKYPFIWDIQSTLEWIDLIGEPNVGIVLDSIHWHTIEGTVKDIKLLKPEQIAYVHINDAKDIPREEVLDNDRLFPGEGAIDLVGFLKALQHINYQGIVSQEILTIHEPTESSAELAKKSKEAMEYIFNKAGI